MSGAGVGVGMLSKYNVACGSKYNVAFTIVECRDGSRYVEGCWGFHYLEIKKRFLGCSVSWFLVYWFQSFLVSKLIVFKVSWSLGFRISKFQRFNDPILPNFHFMLFDRY